MSKIMFCLGHYEVFNADLLPTKLL